MSIARFFPDAQQLIGFVGTQFANRIANGKAVGDIADVYGKIIDESKVTNMAAQWIAQKSSPEEMQKTLGGFTQEERFVLAQYLGLYNLASTQDPKLQELINNILSESLG